MDLTQAINDMGNHATEAVSFANRCKVQDALEHAMKASSLATTIQAMNSDIGNAAAAKVVASLPMQITFGIAKGCNITFPRR